MHINMSKAELQGKHVELHVGTDYGSDGIYMTILGKDLKTGVFYLISNHREDNNMFWKKKQEEIDDINSFRQSWESERNVKLCPAGSIEEELDIERARYKTMKAKRQALDYIIDEINKRIHETSSKGGNSISHFLDTYYKVKGMSLFLDDDTIEKVGRYFKSKGFIVQYKFERGIYTHPQYRIKIDWESEEDKKINELQDKLEDYEETHKRDSETIRNLEAKIKEYEEKSDSVTETKTLYTAQEMKELANKAQDQIPSRIYQYAIHHIKNKAEKGNKSIHLVVPRDYESLQVKDKHIEELCETLTDLGFEIRKGKDTGARVYLNIYWGENNEK